MPDNAAPSLFVDLVAMYDSIGSDRPWFAEGALEGAPLVVFAGAEKSGKSWTLMDLAVAAATGGSWLGAFPVKRQGPPIYIDAEYGPHEFTRRIARLTRGRGMNPRDVLAAVKYVYGAGIVLTDPDALAPFASGIARETTPSVIIADPFRNLLGGDENSATDVIAALNNAGIFRDRFKCPFVLAHHLNRAGSMSGSRAIKGRADVFIEGSDDDSPSYRTIGRTIRRNDRIAQPFVVDVLHENDEDDAIARTRVLARFEGEGAEILSKPARRIQTQLAKRAIPLSTRAIRDALGMNNTDCKRGLEELRSHGVVTDEGGKWSLATPEFFRSLRV